jgi:chemotaxis protein MotB
MKTKGVRNPAPKNASLTLSIAAVCIAAACLFTAGCASTKKLEKLETRNKAMEEQNAAQQEALTEAGAKIEELESQVDGLQATSEEQKSSSEQEIALVKQTYESLVKDLKKEVESGKISIEQARGDLTLKVAEELFFDTGKAEIKPEGKKVLRRIGKILMKIPDKKVRVEGHTDNIPIGPSLKGEYPTNWELSAARAVNVARFLHEEAGIDPRRLSAVAFAQYRPVDSSNTEKGRKKNRRVEIVLVDKEIDHAKKVKGPVKP